MIASFRRTLHARGFIEVETPVLHAEAGGAHARPFVTHYHTLDMPMYLRIALELHLKRLIVGGLDRVFEIGRVFRNEGLSPRHNTEFTMMESYEAYADVNDVMELTEELIVTAARDALGTTVVKIGGRPVDLAEPWPKRRMVDLVSDAIGVEVHPSQPVERLRALAEEHGQRWEPQWGSGRLVEELFGATVERRHRGAGVRHRAPRGDLAAGPRRPRRPVPDGALRAVHRRPGDRQRLQRAQRSGRAAFAVRGRGAGAGRRRRRSRVDRRGLPAGAGVRDAADGRPRRRDGSPRHAAGRCRLDPRRDPLPDVTPGAAIERATIGRGPT